MKIGNDSAFQCCLLRVDYVLINRPKMEESKLVKLTQYFIKGAQELREPDVIQCPRTIGTLIPKWDA